VVYACDLGGPADVFLNQANNIVCLPLIGPIESLNVAVAAGVLLYESLKQRSSVPLPSFSPDFVV